MSRFIQISEGNL